MARLPGSFLREIWNCLWGLKQSFTPKSAAVHKVPLTISPHLFHAPSQRLQLTHTLCLFSYSPLSISPNIMVTKSLFLQFPLGNTKLLYRTLQWALEIPLFKGPFSYPPNNYQPSQTMHSTIRVFSNPPPYYTALKCSEGVTVSVLRLCNKELLHPEGKSGLSRTRCRSVYMPTKGFFRPQQRSPGDKQWGLETHREAPRLLQRGWWLLRGRGFPGGQESANRVLMTWIQNGQNVSWCGRDVAGGWQAKPQEQEAHVHSKTNRAHHGSFRRRRGAIHFPIWVFHLNFPLCYFLVCLFEGEAKQMNLVSVQSNYNFKNIKCVLLGALPPPQSTFP